MTNYTIGKSSFGDLKGVTQYLTSKPAADHFNTAAMEWDSLQTNGDRLTANEGARSRVRQSYMYANRFILGVVVAIPFTSIHDILTHGTAVDVGITDKNGNNRAPTDAEWPLIHQILARHGFVWTGADFSSVEKWHHEGGYPASSLALANPRIAGSEIVTTPVGDAVSTSIIKVSSKTKGKPANVFMVNPETMQCMHLSNSTQVSYWKNRGVPVYPATQSYAVLAGFTRVSGAGAI